MNSKEELRAWACSLVGETHADDVVECLLQPGHPDFGSDWAPYLEGLDVSLIAHTSVKIREMSLKGIVDLKPHGCGIKLICGDWELYHNDTKAIDKDLDALEGLFT